MTEIRRDIKDIEWCADELGKRIDLDVELGLIPVHVAQRLIVNAFLSGLRAAPEDGARPIIVLPEDSGYEAVEFDPSGRRIYYELSANEQWRKYMLGPDFEAIKDHFLREKE